MKIKTETLEKAEQALFQIPSVIISEYNLNRKKWPQVIKFCSINDTIYLQASSLSWSTKPSYWKNKVEKGEITPTSAFPVRNDETKYIRWIVAAEVVELYELDFSLGDFFSKFSSDGTLKGLKKLIKENPSDYDNFKFSDEQIMKAHADYKKYLDLVAQDKQERKNKVVSVVPPRIDQVPFFGKSSSSGVNPTFDDLTLNELVARIEAMGWEVMLKRKGDTAPVVVNEDRRRLLMIELKFTSLERQTCLRLEDLGITTLGQIAQMNKEQLLSAPRIQSWDTAKIEKVLEHYGLHFNLDVKAYLTQQEP
jgi:hypothetical protein